LLNCRRASPDQSGGRPSICSSPATFPPHVTRSRRSSRENVRRSVGRFERKSARERTMIHRHVGKCEAFLSH
jgi:hypothetical protein